MASEIASIQAISFTGGEPFLMLASLKEVISYAKNMYNLPSAVISNGFWATTYTRAHQILQELKDRGLISLCVSADKFHQEFIPLKNVIRAVRAAKDLGLLIGIRHTFTKTESTDSLIKRLIEHGLHPDELEVVPMGYKKREHRNKILIESQACLPQGRAKWMVPSEDIPFRRLQVIEKGKEVCMTDEVITRRCGSAFRVISIDVDGSIFLCCGGDFSVPALSVGSANQISLRKALEVGQFHSILNAVAVHGVKPLLKVLLENGLPIPDKYVDICDLCRFILTHPQYTDILSEHFRRNSLKYLTERILLFRKLISEQPAKRGLAAMQS